MSDETTPLDQAHQALLAAPDDDRARLAFHERLADSELFIVLEEEPKGDRIVPVVMDTSSVPLILAFDRDARMAAFIGGVTPYAALPGRRVVEMLRGSGHGIALNLGVPDGETIVPPESVDWLGGLLRDGPAIGEGRITRLEPPKGLPEALLTALDQKLATMGGLAEAAWLTGVVYEAGTRSTRSPSSARRRVRSGPSRSPSTRRCTCLASRRGRSTCCSRSRTGGSWRGSPGSASASTCPSCTPRRGRHPRPLAAIRASRRS
ncbi:MAG: SseB family protein [Pseudomonadota bacterium]